MSNYTNENLINVPARTLAVKVGDTIFTAGSVVIGQGGDTDYYAYTYVSSNSSMPWKGRKALYAGKIRWARISDTARYTDNFDASSLIALN